jgi:hypothetical protein
VVIKNFYSPSAAGENSGETMIFKRGLGSLFDEIRQSVLKSHLLISPRKTTTSKRGKTGNPELADAINKALATSLSSLGWAPLKAPGASGSNAKLDWYKSMPSGIGYGPSKIGLGLEVQCGNNYQFEADLKRLHEAIIEGAIVTGVCIVASDELAEYKADRGAAFTSEKAKLDRYLTLLMGAGAAMLPGFVLIGVGADGFSSDNTGKFSLTAPVFDAEHGPNSQPASKKYLGTLRNP